MEYLTRNGSKNYHVFTSGNTACKMWLTGGMNQNKKTWHFEKTAPENKQLCTMCKNATKIHILG